MKKFVLFAVVLSLFVSLGFSQTNDDEILGLDGLDVTNTEDAASVTGIEKEAKLNEDFKKNEIYFSVGVPSLVSIVGNYAGVLFIAVPEAVIKGKNNDGSAGRSSVLCLPVTVGYNHFFLNNHLGVGLYGSYEAWLYMNFLTVQAKITGQYGWRYFKIYHSASAGVIVFPEINGGVAPVFDITFLGFKLDFKYMNIFIEGSLPSTAFLKLGASIKF